MRKNELFDYPPDPGLDIIVIIPSYDEPDLSDCLDSLSAAQIPDGGAIEILVIINYPESSGKKVKKQSENLNQQVREYQDKCSGKFRINAAIVPLPDRKAGVGLARRIGMDAAYHRFENLQRDGIIVNLDADCTVAPNYFLAIKEFYQKNVDIWAAGIQFEHPLASDMSADQRNAVIEYELHLRYFIAAQRQIGLPFGFQTVGSCMTVLASAYKKMGGMNTRQAGEDFYFLQKFIAINRFAEINTTLVFPSGRSSHRVPFGTGKAISRRLGGRPQMTYAWASFKEVESLVQRLPALYEAVDIQTWLNNLPVNIREFIEDQGGAVELADIRRETGRRETFISRFYQWFNAFRFMKYLHHARQRYPDQPVISQAQELMNLIDTEREIISSLDLLNYYRKLD